MVHAVAVPVDVVAAYGVVAGDREGNREAGMTEQARAVMAETDVLSAEEIEALGVIHAMSIQGAAYMGTVEQCIRRLCSLLAEARRAAVLSVAFRDVLCERGRQDAKWSEQNHDPITYLAILTEEVGEFAQAALHNRFPKSEMEHQSGAGSYEEWFETKRQEMRMESVHVAAVAIAIVECIDRGKWEWPRPPQGPPLPPREALAIAPEVNREEIGRWLEPPAVQRWIPVSERLPLAGVEVLITVGKTENGPVATWGAASWDGYKRWWGFRGHPLGRTQDIPVLAWMPLPAPYPRKGES